MRIVNKAKTKSASSVGRTQRERTLFRCYLVEPQYRPIGLIHFRAPLLIRLIAIRELTINVKIKCPTFFNFILYQGQRRERSDRVHPCGLFGSAMRGLVIGHVVTGASDIHLGTPMYRTIQHRRSRDFVADHDAPPHEALIGRKDCRIAFMPGIHQLEKQASAIVRQP